VVFIGVFDRESCFVYKTRHTPKAGSSASKNTIDQISVYRNTLAISLEIERSVYQQVNISMMGEAIVLET